MKITLLEGGDVYAPEPVGRQAVLLIGPTIAYVGAVDAVALRGLPFDVEVVDVRGSVVVPGLIDPHSHLIGAGGEDGFVTRTPELLLSDIVGAGITTVVGCLGTDGVGRHLTALLGKVRALEAEGITAYMYTGNYQVPPATMTGSIIQDLFIVDKVIGVGEIAIADARSSQPSVAELMRLVAEASVGGRLSGKAGVTHFHVGSSSQRLALLHRMLDEDTIPPASIYATHINRSAALLDDAIALAKRGAFVDIDTTEHDVARWLGYYREHGGVLDQLTISTDANTALAETNERGMVKRAERTTERALYEQLVACVHELRLPLEAVLPHFTANSARVLKLHTKGRIEAGMDADLLVLDKQTLATRHVWARGRQMVRDGQVIVTGLFE